MGSAIEQVLIRELWAFAYGSLARIRKLQEEIGLHQRRAAQPPPIMSGYDIEYEDRNVKKARLQTQKAQLEENCSWALYVLDSVTPEIIALSPQMRMEHERKRCICGTTPRSSCYAHRPSIPLTVEK